jgi:DNA-binding PadR family transcriptional regulator
VIKLRISGKRILYKLLKRYPHPVFVENVRTTNRGRGKEGRLADGKILERLYKKGLVYKNPRARTKQDRVHYYCLTPEGRKVAGEIAEEVDEYKSW